MGVQLDVRGLGSVCRGRVPLPLALRFLVRPVAEACVLRAREPLHLSNAALTEPAALFLVAEDDRVLARLEHDLEIAAVDGLLRPPAVDDPPLLPDERHALAVDTLRRPTRVCFDERGPGVVYSSRATSRARCSGMRDQGATSTTVQTEPPPVLART